MRKPTVENADSAYLMYRRCTLIISLSPPFLSNSSETSKRLRVQVLPGRALLAPSTQPPAVLQKGNRAQRDHRWNVAFDYSGDQCSEDRADYEQTCHQRDQAGGASKGLAHYQRKGCGDHQVSQAHGEISAWATPRHHGS